MPAAKRKPTPQKPTTALAPVKIPAPPERAWLLTSEEVTIVKNSIAKGASDEELKFCLTVARRYKLDPFKQQIWFVKRWDSGADNSAGGKGAFVWTPQVGINGLLFTAARDHKKEFGSVSLPTYGPMELVEGQGKMKAPEWASVKVWKKGEAEPTEAQAWWSEYAPADLSKAPFWRKMPRRMIAKCATALAIRQAYPDLGGLYIPEEMERMADEYTESGRQITQGPVVGTQGAADAVAARKIAEHNAKSPAPAAQDGRGGPQSTTAGTNASPTKIISVSIPGDASEVAYAYGDLDAKIVQEIKERCDGIKLEDKEMYVMPVANVEVLVQRCKFLGYGYQEVSGMPAPKVGDSTPKASPQAPETAATPSGVGQGASKDAPSAVSGTVKQINPNRKAKKLGAKLHYQVVIGEEIYFCYRDTLWPILDQIRPGMEAEVFIKDRVLRGFKRVASRMFDEDGVTPVIQVNEERPAPGKLFT